MSDAQPRKNLKLTAEAHQRATEIKTSGETWSEFILRAVEQLESDTHREVGPEQTREAVREVLREEATRDLLSVEIESVIEDRITEDIKSATSRDPPKDAIREVVVDILHGEGIIPSGPLPVDRESHNDLVEVIKAAPSRKWVDNFLDMIAELIDITGVTEDDDQLVMSIRTDQKSLPVSLGNRYCLKGYLQDEAVGVILPQHTAAANEFQEDTSYAGQFSGQGEDEEPYWYKFPAASADEVVRSEYHEDWKEAVRDERERGHLRVRADAHEPAVYQAATDLGYRHRLLNDADFDYN